jgi:ADP-ribose pyrophosphatase YjhB (NUDIX family)
MESLNMQPEDSGYIQVEEWDRIQKLVPIVCVDVLPINIDVNSGKLNSYGLIKRYDYSLQKKWCTVGGRLLYGETIAQGIIRQVFITLGKEVKCNIGEEIEPVFIAQYAPTKESKIGFNGFDPRKHAIGLTFCVEIMGHVRPQNEALEFKWFSPNDIPDQSEVGFGQYQIIRQSIKRLSIT